MAHRSWADASDLKNRIVFTLAAMVVCRLGTYIPLPGIDAEILQSIVSRGHGGILRMVDMVSGGALARMTIFALNLMPYISAAFVALLLTATSRRLRPLRKQGAAGRRKLEFYIRVGALFVAVFEAYGIAIGLEGTGGGSVSLVADPGAYFRLTTVTTLTAGTFFLIWLADAITAWGIGNGVALIVFSHVAARMPSAFGSLLEMSRVGQLSGRFVAAFLIVAAAVVAGIVFMESAQRRVVVQYRPRLIGGTQFKGAGSHLRLKLNVAGMVPAIWASSIMLVPAIFVGFGTRPADEHSLAGWLSIHAYHGSWLYLLLYAAVIIVLCYVYAAIVFRPEEAADDLGKYDGFVPGYAPGGPTADHLDDVVTRLTLVGGVYLVAVCVLPEILVSQYAVPFNFGGASPLFMVCVALDVVRQIRAHLGLPDP